MKKIVEITSAELLALYTTAKTLVAAPGAGKVIKMIEAKLTFTFGTVAYDGVATGEDLAFCFTNVSGVQVALQEATGFLDAASGKNVSIARPTVGLTIPKLTPNAPLVLAMLAGNIASGDGTLKVELTYDIIPV